MGWERELHEAVVTKNLMRVHEILDDPIVLKEFTEKKIWKPAVLQCPLHQAAYQGDIGTLKVLLDYGANVNGILDIPSRPPIKMSILHGAVICNEVETVRYLLHRGADVTIQGTYVDQDSVSGKITKLDGSPLSFARAAKTQAIVDILEEHFFKNGNLRLAMDFDHGPMDST
ncbi:hypothetical protein TCAL_14841 [Tigriopus californicus]|uniref:Uncharacterized protein n=1 Tax=Tigriopus californicus TaxID=6832 RepID=A0A553P4I5_TIGCA|nr:hypothetical protein TCAL_14841 [Tigriopus californicus]